MLNLLLQPVGTNIQYLHVKVNIQTTKMCFNVPSYLTVEMVLAGTPILQNAITDLKWETAFVPCTMRKKEKKTSVFFTMCGNKV